MKCSELGPPLIAKAGSAPGCILSTKYGKVTWNDCLFCLWRLFNKSSWRSVKQKEFLSLFSIANFKLNLIFLKKTLLFQIFASKTTNQYEQILTTWIWKSFFSLIRNLVMEFCVKLIDVMVFRETIFLYFYQLYTKLVYS